MRAPCVAGDAVLLIESVSIMTSSFLSDLSLWRRLVDGRRVTGQCRAGCRSLDSSSDSWSDLCTDQWLLNLNSAFLKHMNFLLWRGYVNSASSKHQYFISRHCLYQRWSNTQGGMCCRWFKTTVLLTNFSIGWMARCAPFLGVFIHQLDIRGLVFAFVLSRGGI